MKSKNIINVVAIIIVLGCLGWLGYHIYQQYSSPILIIDSFEGEIKGGNNATVDYGSGAGATVDVKSVDEPVKHGNQSLQIIYDVTSGGYMWIARGYDLTQKNAGQWEIKPENIDWDKYDALGFLFYGENSGNDIAVDLIDSDKEYWRFILKDNIEGWKEVIIPFDLFAARTDWQPGEANRNEILDLPVVAFQCEPKSGKGTIILDKVYLRKKQVKNES